jgi:hypothetical protein
MSEMGESSTGGERGPKSPAVNDSDPVHDEAAGSNEDYLENQATRKSPVDCTKMHEVFKAFQSQLDLQQRQLGQLRGLTKPKESPSALRIPTPRDYARAFKWLNDKNLNAIHLKGLKTFIRDC